jgi:hypothetical protein
MPENAAMDEAVRAFLDSIPWPDRRRDAETMIALMRRATGQEPRISGSIVGFGTYHYRYASGREGDGPAAAFAARKPATTVYLPDGIGTHADALQALGPHSTGVGCLYLKDLETVDLEALERIVAASYVTVTSGVFSDRAREGGTASR